MITDITIGQYVPTGSFIHKLDARVKIVLIVVYSCVLFIIKTPISYLAYTIFTATLIFMSDVPLKFIVKGLRPMLFILVFTAALNIFTTDGTVVLTIFEYKNFIFRITDNGIYLAASMAVRLILLFAGTSLLTLTTTPIMLTDAIEYIIAPLVKTGVPVHDIAMMMTVAMRFIPTLTEETDRIMKAQTARGADFEDRNIIKRAKAMLPVFVPLFLSAFRRADELACAMDSRCYNNGKNHTRMKTMKITKNDTYAIYISGIFFICIIALEIFFKF